jgi:hypothetical protein
MEYNGIIPQIYQPVNTRREQAPGLLFLRGRVLEIRAGAFEQKQGLFLFDAPGVTGKASAGADNPVARDEKRNGVAPDRAAYRPGRRALVSGDPFGDPAVGAYLSVGYGQKLFPNGFLKISPPGINAEGGRRFLSFKIFRKPFPQGLKNRVIRFRRPFTGPRGKMFLSRKP